MDLSPAVHRLLYALVAVFLVSGVLAAAVVGGGDDDAQDVVAESTTTTTAPATPTAETIVASPTGDGGDPRPAPQPGAPAPSTTVAAKSAAAPSLASTAPPTTVAPPAASTSGFTDLGPAEDGGAVEVPKAGTYRYALTRSGETKEGTTKVEDKGAAPDGARKLVLTIAGQGFDSANDVLWGPGDVKITKSIISFGGKQYDCDWEPDYVELVLPLKKGVAWDSTSTCSLSGFGPTPVTVKRTTTNKVADARRVRIAGEELSTWVITGTEKIEAGGQPRGEATTTTWFSGRHGLVVRSEAQTSEGKSELVIQNLTPA